MREEEKLARDVYLALDAQWQAAIFAQIAASETQHMEAVKLLLDRYGLADPAAGKAAGMFANPLFRKRSRRAATPPGVRKSSRTAAVQPVTTPPASCWLGQGSPE